MVSCSVGIALKKIFKITLKIRTIATKRIFFNSLLKEISLNNANNNINSNIIERSIKLLNRKVRTVKRMRKINERVGDIIGAEITDETLLEVIAAKMKLTEAIVKLREITRGIGQMSEQMGGFQGNIAIQGDREITFDLLKKIMLTCGQVGYNNMLLTVTQKE